MEMYDQYMSQLNNVMAPIRALNDQNIEYVEKVSELQVSAMQSVFELNYSYIRGAMQLVDEANIKEYLEQQQEAMRDFNNQFIAELKDFNAAKTAAEAKAKTTKSKKAAAPKAA